MRQWADKKIIEMKNWLYCAMCSERGDTNFISIILILGVVVILAGLFITFSDTIVGTVRSTIESFTVPETFG